MNIINLPVPPIKPEPVISPAVDALVDTLEGAGMIYYALAGTNPIDPPFLAFEFHRGEPTLEACQAAHALAKLFNSDAEIRRAIVDHSFAMGGTFVPTDCDKPVWNIDEANR